MEKTDISQPDYFHKVVDCQWACPAHTNVPEYIRLISAGRYTDSYMLNWVSNVFPGILGRTCDRPCEPACRRGRVEEQPVAICRLKRVAADFKGDIEDRLPQIPARGNGRRIALVGAGPASLTVARDLAPLGYECVIYDKEHHGGGMMRSQIPAFRLPLEVLDEEVGRVTGRGGVETRYGTEVSSLKGLLDEGYDAVFVGSGAPRGKDLDLPGREAADANIHIGIDWLASVAFGHTDRIGRRVVVIGGGNTAMDCCRSALRLGGEDVTVTVRSGYEEMKASPWEKEDAQEEGIPFLNFHNPKEFVVRDGALVGVLFDKVEAQYDDNGRRKLIPTGEEVLIECDDVLMAIGQDNAFPWIERDVGVEFDEWGMPQVDRDSMRSTHPQVFFGGDAAFGPENIIWAVAHGHAAAISIHQLCEGLSPQDRPPPLLNLVSQKMSLHEWSYGNDYSGDQRYRVPHADRFRTLKDIRIEVELGYDEELARQEASRCLNCDVQTVFSESLCIECDACVDICPMDCINFTDNAPEPELRASLRVPARNAEQAVYVSEALPTGRIMAKDEDVCLHCGLCAERCPTGAWDMQKSIIQLPQAGAACRS